MIETRRLFPRLNREKGAPEVAVQALLYDAIHGLNFLKQQDVLIWPLFADLQWRLVRSAAPQRSWLTVLQKNGFPCRVEKDTAGRINAMDDLVEIGLFADADRDKLLNLTMWLAASLSVRSSCLRSMSNLTPESWKQMYKCTWRSRSPTRTN